MQLCLKWKTQPVHASCVQQTHASACPRFAFSILLLIDALNPGSRESEIHIVVVVSCFASAISLDISALDHRPLMLVRCMRSIERESGDGIDEILEVMMVGL
jgi:hypothetical protein